MATIINESTVFGGVRASGSLLVVI